MNLRFECVSRLLMATFFCVVSTPVLALRLDVKETEVPHEDRQACHAMATAWSNGTEFQLAVRPVNAPKTYRAIKLRGFGDASDGLTEGRWIGKLVVSGGPNLDIIEVQSGGTCRDVQTVLARRVGKASANTFQAVVSPGNDVEREFESPAKEAYDALRWGSSFGIIEKLFQVNGKIYKATGRFVDLRPASKDARGSNNRSLSLLFKRKRDVWTPICSFEAVEARFRTKESAPICQSLSQGKFVYAESVTETRTFMLSGAKPDVPPLAVRVGSYDSGAGCGATYRWLYADDEFLGKTREQVLKTGVRKSLSLNGVTGYGSPARGALELLYERYVGAGSSVNNDERWPDFADTNLQVLEVNGVNVIQRTAQIYPFNAWNYDIDILQNYRDDVFITCHAQLLKQMLVKFWYQP
jgi:hypothetical protein